MLKKTGMLVFVFLLVISFVSGTGTTTYRQAGGEGFDWLNEGRGTFAGIGTNINTFGKSLSAPFQIPIIDDFDNDSISDMFILDGDTGRIYQNKELDIIATVDIGSTPTEVSNIISFDIDGDGINEIIFADNTNDLLFILNFSSSEGLQVQKQFAITINEFPQIACRVPNECIITVDSKVTEDIFDPFDGFYRGFSFDSTGLTSSLTTIFSQNQPASNAIAICSPRNQNIPVIDIDGDGILEFGIVIGVTTDTSPELNMKFFWLDNLTIDVQGSLGGGADAVMSCTGENGVSNFITSPLGKNLFTAHAGIETFIGTQTSDNDFRIQGFKSDGSFFDQFPETILSEGDGTMISNVFLMNAFPSTSGALDFCILGYDFDNGEIDLVCGTEDRGFLIPQSSEFKFPVANLFNISTDISKKTNIVHGVQHSNELTDLQDLNEIISAYGIFTLDFVLINELKRVFQNPQGDSVILSIDFEQFGVDDLIAMTDTNIIYMDDKLSNEPARIDDVTFNPCVINSVIKVNTTLQVTVDASDTNAFALGFDDLNISISVYDGTPDQNKIETKVTTSQVDGSTTIIEQFTLNKTGSGKIIRIEVFDTGNPTEIASVEQVFNVQVNGIEFGDSTCTLIVTVPPDEVPPGENATLTEDADENAVVSGLTTFSSLTGLAGTTIWLILMMILSLGIWSRAGELGWSGGSALGAMGITNAMFIILGARLGILSTGLVAIITVIVLVILGVTLGKFITGEKATA